MAYYHEIFTNLLGMIIFLATIKFLRLLRFNNQILFFSKTLTYSGRDLRLFSVVFFIVYIAFGIWAFVVFGPVLKEFKSFIATMELMFGMLLGKLELNIMEEADM